MARLDRVVLKELAGPFVGAAGMFTTLFFAADGLQRITDYIQRGESIDVILKVVFYTLPTILPYTVPMAMLLAALLAFQRLNNDSEVVAMLAAGISFPRIVAPALVFALAIACPIIWLNQKIIPDLSYLRQATIDEARNRGSAALSSRNAFDFANNAGNGKRLVIHAEGGVEFLPGGQARMRGVSVTLWNGESPQVLTSANRADWKVGTRNWVLDDNVVSFNFVNRVATWTGQLQLTEVSLGTPDELRSLTRPVGELVTERLFLRARMRRQAGQENEAREAEVEVARRYAFPMATVVFVLVGAPLGIQPRRNDKGMGFGLAVLLTFGYWTLMQVGMAVGKGGALPPLVAAQIPNLMGLAAAAVLVRRVAR